MRVLLFVGLEALIILIHNIRHLNKALLVKIFHSTGIKIKKYNWFHSE